MKNYLVLKYHILMLFVHYVFCQLYTSRHCFSVNLLARYNSAPTQRHWNDIKYILRYFRGTIDMSLFYSRGSKQQLVGYVDVGYLSDPHKGRSQTGYVFNCNDTTISWRSVKQTMVATSSNHSEILAIH